MMGGAVSENWLLDRQTEARMDGNTEVHIRWRHEVMKTLIVYKYLLWRTSFQPRGRFEKTETTPMYVKSCYWCFVMLSNLYLHEGNKSHDWRSSSHKSHHEDCQQFLYTCRKLGAFKLKQCIHLGFITVG